MRVEVGDILITSDQYQFTVRQKWNKDKTRRKAGDQKDHYEILGYYTDIRQALRATFGKLLRKSKASSMSEVIQAVDKAYKQIDALASELRHITPNKPNSKDKGNDV